jgi:ABC-type transporter Mla subunit MlaD
MTSEEIQAAIEGMLQIQREVQNKQLRQSEQIADLIDNSRRVSRQIEDLETISRRQERRLERLEGDVEPDGRISEAFDRVYQEIDEVNQKLDAILQRLTNGGFGDREH